MCLTPAESAPGWPRHPGHRSKCLAALLRDFDEHAGCYRQQIVVEVVTGVVAHDAVLAKKQIGTGSSLQEKSEVISEREGACVSRHFVVPAQYRGTGLGCRI